MKRQRFKLIWLAAIGLLLLAACTPQTSSDAPAVAADTTVSDAEQDTAVATEPPSPTDAPTEDPTAPAEDEANVEPRRVL